MTHVILQGIRELWGSFWSLALCFGIGGCILAAAVRFVEAKEKA